MKIAIQGEPGSFSHEAALKLAPGAEIVPCAISGGGVCGAELRSSRCRGDPYREQPGRVGSGALRPAAGT